MQPFCSMYSNVPNGFPPPGLTKFSTLGRSIYTNSNYTGSTGSTSISVCLTSFEKAGRLGSPFYRVITVLHSDSTFPLSFPLGEMPDSSMGPQQKRTDVLYCISPIHSASLHLSSCFLPRRLFFESLCQFSCVKPVSCKGRLCVR